ncbi:protein GFS12 isoform X1 [Tanacetum coccineum]
MVNSGGLTLLFNQAGDSTPEELATATQVQGPVLPILREKPTTELVKVTEEMKSFKTFAKIRLERTNKHHQGARLKKAAEAEKLGIDVGVGPGFKGSVQKWDLSRIASSSGYDGHEEVLNDICVQASTERTASCDGTIHVWNSQSGKNISVITEHAENSRQYRSSLTFVSRIHFEQADMLDFSSLGSGILSSTYDGSLYTCMHHLETVNRLVSGTGNGSLRFIDMNEGQKLHLWRSDPVETSFPSFISSICSCGSTKMQANEGAASPSWIAAGLSSGHCRLLNTRSGNIITSWQAHKGYVTKVYRIPNGWQWAYWVSPLSYSFNALAINEFFAQRWMNKLENDKSSKLGVAILQNIGLTPDRNLFWIGSAALLSLAVGIPRIPKIVDEQNPATWMLDVTSVAAELSLGIDLAQHYKSSSVYQFIQTYMTHIIVGMGVGGLDVICVKQKPSSTISPTDLRGYLEDLRDCMFSDGPVFLYQKGSPKIANKRFWKFLIVCCSHTLCSLPTSQKLQAKIRKQKVEKIVWAKGGMFAVMRRQLNHDEEPIWQKVLKEAETCAKKKTKTSKILKDNVVKVDQDLHQKFIDNTMDKNNGGNEDDGGNINKEGGFGNEGCYGIKIVEI